MALLYVIAEASCQPGPQRHKATLAELRLANEQSVALEINISQFQPDCFADTQAETVQQGEDHLVGLRPARGPRTVRELTNQFQEALGIVEVEEIWNALSGITASRGLHGIARDETLHYGPFKEPMEYAEETIVTTWPGSWSRLEEVFDQDAVDRVPPGCIVLTEVPVEKAQSRRLRPVFAVERSLVLNESANRLS